MALGLHQVTRELRQVIQVTREPHQVTREAPVRLAQGSLATQVEAVCQERPMASTPKHRGRTKAR